MFQNFFTITCETWKDAEKIEALGDLRSGFDIVGVS